MIFPTRAAPPVPFHRSMLLQGLLLVGLAACNCGGLPPEEEPQPDPQPDPQPPALTLTGPAEPVELETGWQVEVPLVLSGLETAVPTWSLEGLPEGVSADVEPAEAPAGGDHFILKMQADADAELGQRAIGISATADARVAGASLTLEVVSGVIRGTVLTPLGAPLQGAIVSVPGSDADPVEVDASGAWEIRHRERPYQLRVDWPETGAVHVYRSVEVDRLELYPFRMRYAPGSARHSMTVQAWLPAENFGSLSRWISSPAGDAAFTTFAHHASGELKMWIGFEEPGPAVVELLTRNVDGNGVVTFSGYAALELELVPGAALELGQLNMESPETFSFTPTVELPEDLTLSRACHFLETVPRRNVYCAYDMSAPLLFPLLGDAPGGVRYEFYRADMAETWVTVHGLGPSTPTAAFSVPSPPTLVEPFGTEMDPWELQAADGRFIVEMAGAGPLTYTFEADDVTLYVTTHERELAAADLRVFFPEAASTWTRWTVSALPEETELHLRSPGAVIAAEDWAYDSVPASVGDVPVFTTSGYSDGTIVW